MDIELHNNPINVVLSEESPTILTLQKSTFDVSVEKDEVTYEIHSSPNATYEMHQDPNVELQLEKDADVNISFQTNVVSKTNGNIKHLTQEEFDSISVKDKSYIYVTYNKKGELMQVWFGDQMIAKRDENGYFPYKFPIIFR